MDWHTCAVEAGPKLTDGPDQLLHHLQLRQERQLRQPGHHQEARRSTRSKKLLRPAEQAVVVVHGYVVIVVGVWDYLMSY